MQFIKHVSTLCKIRRVFVSHSSCISLHHLLSLCRLGSWFPVRVRHVHIRTVGWAGQRGAGSRRPPYRRHTPFQNILFYLQQNTLQKHRILFSLVAHHLYINLYEIEPWKARNLLFQVPKGVGLGKNQVLLTGLSQHRWGTAEWVDNAVPNKGCIEVI